jgi:hypothetical protein
VYTFFRTTLYIISRLSQFCERSCKSKRRHRERLHSYTFRNARLPNMLQRAHGALRRTGILIVVRQTDTPGWPWCSLEAAHQSYGRARATGLPCRTITAIILWYFSLSINDTKWTGRLAQCVLWRNTAVVHSKQWRQSVPALRPKQRFSKQGH